MVMIVIIGLKLGLALGLESVLKLRLVIGLGLELELGLVWTRTGYPKVALILPVILCKISAYMHVNDFQHFWLTVLPYNLLYCSILTICNNLIFSP